MFDGGSTDRQSDRRRGGTQLKDGTYNVRADLLAGDLVVDDHYDGIELGG